MQVILQQDIPNVGKAGDVVTVREGYARNYLLPKKLAEVADPGNLKQLEHHKRVVATKISKMKKSAEELAVKLSQLSVTISRESGEGDKLFGSVTNKDLAEALRAEGFTVDRHDIRLEDTIKTLGIFDIPVRLHPEVVGTFKVWVVKK